MSVEADIAQAGEGKTIFVRHAISTALGLSSGL